LGSQPGVQATAGKFVADGIDREVGVLLGAELAPSNWRTVASPKALSFSSGTYCATGAFVLPPRETLALLRR